MEGFPSIRPLLAEIGLLEVFGAENLPDFGGPFPPGPMLQVELHELLCAFDRFLFGLQIENRKAADDLFGFGERTVGSGNFILGDADGGAGGYWGKAAIGDHRAGFDGRFAMFIDCVDQCLRRRTGKFACGFDQHHESHSVYPFFGVGRGPGDPKPAARLEFHYYDE